jgi:hypothetical protein
MKKIESSYYTNFDSFLKETNSGVKVEKAPVIVIEKEEEVEKQ